MASRSEDQPRKPGPPLWAMIYIFVLGAVIVWGGLVALHGYRQWWVDLFFGIVAVAMLGGSIKHRLGDKVPLP